MNWIYQRSKLRQLNAGQLIWAVAIIGIILFQGLPGPRPLDDSFITFRYARNIISGAGFVYNPGELVQGTTTPLYTLILALLSIPFGTSNLPNISFGIALIADVLNTVLLFRIARHLLKQELPAFVLAMVFLLQPLRINVAAGGMETSLFIFVLLAAYHRYLIDHKTYAAAILCALAILIRIDAVFAIAPIFLHAFWKDRHVAFKATLLGIAILAPWFLWATVYFGNPIPFSIHAKMAAYQSYTAKETLLLILTFLGTGTVGPYRQMLVIFPGLVIALFLLINGIHWVTKGNQASLVVIGYPFLYFIVMTIQHAPLFFCWYYLPLMPGLLLLFFGALQTMTSARYRTRGAHQPRITLGLFAASLILIPAMLMRFLPGWADSREIEKLYQEASSSIQGQAAGKLVFAPDIGVIGWQLEKSRILDPIGLVSPISLTYMEENSDISSKDNQMIRDLQPDYVVARQDFVLNLVSDSVFLTDYELIWKNQTSPSVQHEVVVYKRR